MGFAHVLAMTFGLSLAASACTTLPLVIAHRGASGYLPEHTLEAYELAIDQGADFVEPDLVPTRDGVLISRHENELSATTDVAGKFPARKATKTIDGQAVTGWFSEDLTLQEIRTLRARQRLPFRDHSRDGLYAIPTFEEILELVRRKEQEKGRQIGIYPETKSPSYFATIGLPVEPPLLKLLSRFGYVSRKSPVFIQSFEAGNLKDLRRHTQIRLIQLLEGPMPPLAPIAQYADGIGIDKSELEKHPELLKAAHDAGLLVHVYTFRDEEAEYRAFFRMGVDAVFSDFPDVAIRARVW